jgi:hypothetical protein
MMSPLAVVVDAHIAAFNARDTEALVAGFAHDAVFTTGEHTVVGTVGLRVLFGDAFAAPLRATMEVRERVIQGDTVAAELVERLEFEGSVAEIALAAFYTVRDGLLTRVKVYREAPTDI